MGNAGIWTLLQRCLSLACLRQGIFWEKKMIQNYSSKHYLQLLDAATINYNSIMGTRIIK